MARSTKSKKPRPPERDYSHRSLLDKLGVKSGQRIAVLGIEDPQFLADLVSRVPEFSRDAPAEPADIICVAAESISDLSRVEAVAKHIQRDGAIWIVYPKGQKHIREIDVMAAGKSAGLTDNKVCRFFDTHTALRFVIPLARPENLFR